MGNQLVLVSKNDLILIWLGDFYHIGTSILCLLGLTRTFFADKFYYTGTVHLALLENYFAISYWNFFLVNSRSINFVYFLEDNEKMTSLSNLPRRIQFISVSVMNLSSMTVLWKRFSLNVFCYLSFRDSREVNVSFVNYVETTWSVSTSLLFYKSF